jgi:hypothetical protein
MSGTLRRRGLRRSAILEVGLLALVCMAIFASPGGLRCGPSCNNRARNLTRRKPECACLPPYSSRASPCL